jgi:hypothetical protein
MNDGLNTEALVQRARWEAAHARPYFAYRLYWEAWSRLPEEARADQGPRLLNAALDLCLDYLEKDAPEIVRVTDALLGLIRGGDARALLARGEARSLSARALRRGGAKEAAWATAGEAERDLTAATRLTPFDAVAWGSLGGLYKRMGSWARADGDAAAAKAHDHRMLAAYEQGKEGNRDAYTLLNFLEYRAVVSARSLAGTKKENGPPLLRMVRSDEEREELARALEVRRQQFRRGEDSPWAAFDLARGQHYLQPDVLRFVADLGVAVGEAQRVARSGSDRWMVEAAQASLRDLDDAGYPLDGIEEALLLLGRAASADTWSAGNWAPLARGEDYLVGELRQARDELARVAETHAGIARFIERTEQRWSREDEEQFQKDLERFAKDVEPPAKKHLRVLWKVFGEEALASALTELPALLGAGPLPAVGALVATVGAKYLLANVGGAGESA